MDLNNMYQYNPYQQMPYMGQQRTLTTNVSWVYVNGIEGAKSQIVQPGQTSWMMDNNDSIIYVKTVDSMGTATFKAFRLTEVNAQPTTPANDYVTKSDLESVVKRLQTLENELGGLNT